MNYFSLNRITFFKSRTRGLNFISNIYKNVFFLCLRRFKWEEYIFPTTLLVAPFVKILLDKWPNYKYLNPNLELGLHEALINAVRHGNKEDVRKVVRVRRIITVNWIVWQIQDEGIGFPLSERNCSLPTDLESKGGRGLYLIQECFDDVRWNGKGSRLQVAMKRN